MDIWLKLLTVLALGAVELWAAIPAGFALQLHPLVTGVVAAVGAVLGVAVVLLLGQGVRAWLAGRHSGGQNRQPGRIYGVWARYGVVGLGLLAPLLVGAPVGAALGLTLGAPPDRLLLWLSAGIVLWSSVLTVAGALGLAGLEALRY